MIALLTGTLAEKSPGIAVIDVSGVGYEVHIPLPTYDRLPDEGGEVRLHIHTHVREFAISLFGFSNPREKVLFLLLLGISGVGPKVALGILSGLPYDSLVGAISSGDEKLVSTIPGVGKKTAARIVLELKEKLEGMGIEPSGYAAMGGGPGGPERSEAVSALVNLGYKKPAAEQAVSRICKGSDSIPPVEDIIRKALKSLSR
jgi:Holliday junction DNA helicase RuvA